MSETVQQRKTPPTDQKLMTVKEFWEFGLLQEANRLFFHPLGLALALAVTAEEAEALEASEETLNSTVMRITVWDGREDPEGFEFAEGTIDPEKAQRVNELGYAHKEERFKKFESFIQPPFPVHPRAPEARVGGPEFPERPDDDSRVQAGGTIVQPEDDPK